MQSTNNPKIIKSNLTVPKTLFGFKSAGVYLDLSRSALEKAVRKNNLKSFKWGRRVFFTRDALDQFAYDIEAQKFAA